MKKRILSITLLLISAITAIIAADYASINGDALSLLNKQTDQVSILYDTDDASINGKTYKAYKQSLNAKQSSKYDADIIKLKQYIVKQFNQANKQGFQLTDQGANYTAEVNIKKLSFTEGKGRAKITAAIDIRENDSPQIITQIRLTDFEGGKKSGTLKQLQQLTKDIIEYLTIYL